MSSGRVPGPIGSGGNSQTIDDGTLQRTLSRVPGIIGAPTNAVAEQSVRPPLLPASRGAVKPPPTVQFGSRGALVQRLQRLLNERLSPSPQLPINGVFDATTLAAVKQYQQHLHLTVDGRVGRDTWYRLHKGDIAVIPGAPKPVEKPAAITKPNISAWTLEQKFTRVLELTPPKLPGHMREEFMKLLDPTALAILVGTLIVWAASHAFGVGVAVDIALLIGGVVFIGMAAIDAAGHLYDFLTLTATADEETDLDQAAVMLAKAVSILGVGAFAALLTKGAAKRGAKKTAPPEQKPLMKEPGPKVARDEPEPPKSDDGKRTKTKAPPPSKEEIALAKKEGATVAQVAAREKVSRHYLENNGFDESQIADALGSKDGKRVGGIDLTKPVEVVSFPPPETMGQYVKPHGFPGNWFDPTGKQTPDAMGISGEGRTYKSFSMPKGDGLSSCSKPVVDTWTNPANPVTTNGGGQQLYVNDAMKSQVSAMNRVGG